MAFDYKKEYPEFYLPPRTPRIVDVPSMNFVAVHGEGDPNEEDGCYKQAMGLLYGIAFTLKMSPRAGHAIKGYFEYTVPPLEGFWWMPGDTPMDYARKCDLQWISAIRLPEFVDEEDFAWAVAEAARKKKLDFSSVEFLPIHEGVCVQCMHIGPYDDEPATVAAMDSFARAEGYEPDFSDTRHHHEIYLSDARRCDPARLKTVIRHPIRMADD
jgi:hypothetical protein